MAARPSDRAEAVTSLANLALDSGRNRKIIIEEGGVPPLLALLRDGAASLDAQIAAATTVINLSANRELVTLIVADLAVPIVVQVLADSPMRLQDRLAVRVGRMARPRPRRPGGVRPRERHLPPRLPPLLRAPLDDTSPNSKKPTIIHSLVRIYRESDELQINCRGPMDALPELRLEQPQDHRDQGSPLPLQAHRAGEGRASDQLPDDSDGDCRRCRVRRRPSPLGIQDELSAAKSAVE